MKDEQHEQQFRGTWARPEYFDALYDRKITSNEFALLIVLDAFRDQPGTPPPYKAVCRYMGGADEHVVRRMVKRLAALRLYRE